MPISIYIIELLTIFWVALGGLFFYKSTANKQSIAMQLLAFISTPFMLAPILAIIYVLVILLPLYNLVNKSGF